MKVARKAILQVAGEIAERFRPQKVILFGSHAYGTPTRDSDVDFLVILDTTQSNLRQALEISRRISHPFPMDILVLKPNQVEKRLNEGDLVLREILTGGDVLYEASDRRMG